MLGSFIKDFFSIFFGGMLGFFYSSEELGNYGGVFGGLRQMFAIDAYIEVFQRYSDKLSAGQWVLAALCCILVIAVLVAMIWVGVHYLRRFFNKLFGSKIINQDYLDEISNLKRELVKTTREKDRILGMKVSNAGYDQDFDEEQGEGGEIKEGESRFFKLTEVDAFFEDYKEPDYDNEITLEELCDRFRNFAASKLKLYYEKKVVRLFFAGFSTTRLIILQGISGTGKTSLPYAVGQFLNNPATIASVQPSWRDRTELFGYFNEFTKRFNETQVLKMMYEATYSKSIYVTVLDEMNIARVEYYFAEMLSILEMPSRKSWIVDLVPSGWPSDPKHVVKGRFNLPVNMWFVGTANNDDSTFAVSDKVYDRAIPINIDTKGVPFDAPDTEKMYVSAEHLENMFKVAQEKHKVSEENLQKVANLDDYVIEHFRLAFGNRIVKQLKEFVPSYVACGGTELDGLDYILANKILRKFESLNLSYIRDEVDGLVSYLNEQFGEENMYESKAYLMRLKRLF